MMLLLSSAVLIVLSLCASSSLAVVTALEHAMDPIGVPVHPYLAGSDGSTWSISHQNTFATDSTWLSGPDFSSSSSAAYDVDFFLRWWPPLASANPITLALSKDNRYIWTSTLSSIIKLKRTVGGSLEEVAVLKRSAGIDFAFHGAYSLLSETNDFYIALKNTILRFSNKVPTDEESGIVQTGEFAVPEMTSDDKLIGLSMTYCGKLVYATESGLVGVIPSDMLGAPVSLRLPGDNVQISNTFAVDETGAIFIVTDRYLAKVQWIDEDAASLNVAWTSEYTDEQDPFWIGRLGRGSGSSPSITTAFGERFVVITDGRSPMSLLYFRCSDGAIIASKTVLFDSDQSQSEQSVVVDGARAFVVNNWVDTASIPWVCKAARGISSNIWANVCPFIMGEVSHGTQQFELVKNPLNHTDSFNLKSTWMNADISCATSIPVLSTASNAVYCIGQREGQWTYESMDWDSGASSHKILGSYRFYNPLFAASEVISDGEIISGTMGGILRIHETSDPPHSSAIVQ